MFYAFYQNSSFGLYYLDSVFAPVMIVESDSVDDANARAIDIGIYFDDVNTGKDCPCCGDRWKMVDQDDATPRPIWRDQNVKSMSKTPRFHDDYVECRVFYKDGTVKSYYRKH